MYHLSASSCMAKIELNARLFMRYFFRFKEKKRKLSLGCDRVAICKEKGEWCYYRLPFDDRSFLFLVAKYASNICLTSIYQFNKFSFILEDLGDTSSLISITSPPIFWKKKGNLWKSFLFKSLSDRYLPYRSLIHFENKVLFFIAFYSIHSLNLKTFTFVSWIV